MRETVTMEEKFFETLSEKMVNGGELSLRMIYSLFPETNRKTISWRLYSLVQRGKLYKTGHGMYSLRKNVDNVSAGYSYLQEKSKAIYDSLVEYGYNFYISGLDSLVGEILHIPESFPVIVIIEESGMKEIQEVLNGRDMIALTEKQRDFFESPVLRNKVDVILLKGKDFSLATNSIAQKEKGFIDLYYAITRLEYGISVPELSRVYESLERNHTITRTKIKSAAKDRGITVEINWLLELNKATKKTIEFMRYQMKEADGTDQY